jgi:hypothetical protein
MHRIIGCRRVRHHHIPQASPFGAASGGGDAAAKYPSGMGDVMAGVPGIDAGNQEADKTPFQFALAAVILVVLAGGLYALTVSARYAYVSDRPADWPVPPNGWELASWLGALVWLVGLAASALTMAATRGPTNRMGQILWMLAAACWAAAVVSGVLVHDGLTRVPWLLMVAAAACGAVACVRWRRGPNAH